MKDKRKKIVNIISILILIICILCLSIFSYRLFELDIIPTKYLIIIYIFLVYYLKYCNSLLAVLCLNVCRILFLFVHLIVLQHF